MSRLRGRHSGITLYMEKLGRGDFKEEWHSSQHGAEFACGSEKSLFGIEGTKGRWLGNGSSRRTGVSKQQRLIREGERRQIHM